MRMMRGRRLARLLAVVAALAGAALIARPYVHGLSFVIRAAEMNGTMRRIADLDTIATREREIAIPSTRGPLRARLYQPSRSTRRTALLVSGLHAAGIDEPRLVALARHLSANGLAIVTPDIPELSRFEITPAITNAIEEAGVWLAADSGLAADHRVGLMGISFSGGLSVIAAGRPSMKDRAAFVFAFGGHDDLPRVLRYLCTGIEERPGAKVRLRADNGADEPFVRAPLPSFAFLGSLEEPRRVLVGGERRVEVDFDRRSRRVREWIGETNAARPPSNLPEVGEQDLRAPAVGLHLGRLALVPLRRGRAALERALRGIQEPLHVGAEFREERGLDPLAQRLARFGRRGVQDHGRAVAEGQLGRRRPVRRRGLASPGLPALLPVKRPENRPFRLRDEGQVHPRPLGVQRQAVPAFLSRSRVESKIQSTRFPRPLLGHLRVSEGNLDRLEPGTAGIGIDGQIPGERIPRRLPLQVDPEEDPGRAHERDRE